MTKRFWLQSRRDAAITVVILLIVAYALVSRAIDTGSLGQYGLAIALVFLASNRLGMVIHPAQ